MAGMRRPTTARSRAAMPNPASAPHAGSPPGGKSLASTPAQPTDSARCTGTAARSRTGVRPSCGSSMAPAARAPSSTSSPRTSDHAVEGIDAQIAPARPATSASL
jgi:hypothetical protein